MADQPAKSTTNARGHQYGDTYATNSRVIQGDVINYYNNYIYSDVERQELGKIKHHGLCLTSAPVIDPSYFVGRAAELEKMKQVLQPSEIATEQRRLVLGGIGGVGKTQLAIAYARLHQSCYTSVFWLNAVSDLTLKEGFRQIAQRLLKAEELEKLNSEQLITRVHQWLCDGQNMQWLLVLDNYDDPDQFAINEFIPNAAHGSIILTTRLPDLVTGTPVRVQPIVDQRESLEILRTRSLRSNIEDDPDACRLADRLAGLPLALATAGAYLRKTTMTFQQYLQTYEQRFNVNSRRPVQLQEYQNRTLYTTWNLTYSRLESYDLSAAKTLRLLAYFDNQEIWFRLLHMGLTDQSQLPEWLTEIAADSVEFENVMSTLVDYCLLEAHPARGSYSIHNCVHDWTLAELNQVVDQQLYWYVVDCVMGNIDQNDWGSLGQLRYARLTRHALRCTHSRFQSHGGLNDGILDSWDELLWIAQMLKDQDKLVAAEQMYTRALAGQEKALGSDQISTLDTVNNLGNLYTHQNKLDEAELMYRRALNGYDKILGSDHVSTLMTVVNLGIWYKKQGKLNEAEQLYKRALVGYDKNLGSNDALTLSALNNLGNLYTDQDKPDEAERMFLRVLAGREKVLGQNHTSTLDAVNNLGALYHRQGKQDQAEQMYIRALAGYEKTLGKDHSSTQRATRNLASLYHVQHKSSVQADPLETGQGAQTSNQRIDTIV